MEAINVVPNNKVSEFRHKKYSEASKQKLHFNFFFDFFLWNVPYKN